jgi:hypothetical protein
MDWWNCWPSMFKLSFVLLILVELLAINVYTFFCFVDIGGIVGQNSDGQEFHQYQQNKRKFKQ